MRPKHFIIILVFILNLIRVLSCLNWGILYMYRCEIYKFLVISTIYIPRDVALQDKEKQMIIFLISFEGFDCMVIS